MNRNEKQRSKSHIDATDEPMRRLFLVCYDANQMKNAGMSVVVVVFVVFFIVASTHSRIHAFSVQNADQNDRWILLKTTTTIIRPSRVFKLNIDCKTSFAHTRCAIYFGSFFSSMSSNAHTVHRAFGRVNKLRSDRAQKDRMWNACACLTLTFSMHKINIIIIQINRD